MFDTVARDVQGAALEWRGVPILDRLRLLRSAGELLRDNREALLDCLRADGLSTALAEYYGAWILRQAEPDLLEQTANELLRTTPARDEVLVRRPDGVVALITPGNSPTINTAPLFSMLLVGNGVIMRAPGSDGGVRLIASQCVGATLASAGYSPKLVQVVTGKTRPLLEQIYASPIVDTIVFFGNAASGKSVAERGHAAGKKVVLELEGSDCMVVWSDANLDAALDSATRGFDFSTQPCPIPKHFLVHPAIRSAFVAGLCERANALASVEADPEAGPLVPLFRPEKFDLLLEQAKRCGEIACGGHRTDATGQPSVSGQYGAPTVVVLEHDAALLSSPLFREEINVPILPVVSYAGDDAAILQTMVQTINEIPFGLRTSIWTADDEIATSFVRDAKDVGLVLVNKDHAHHPCYLSPWGGPKRSGGPHGESHLFWQKTSRLQGVAAPPHVIRKALLGAGDKLELNIVDQIAWLTLNRPERHNAIDQGLAAELSDAVDQLVTQAQDLRGVVLRGAGSSFCSGADLTMLRHLDAKAARRFMQDVTWTLRQLERLPVPSLALVRGFCVGGGFEFALHCDAIIASADAKFGLPEVRHGLTTTAGAVGRLVQAVGKRRASQWLLTGARIDAATAEAAGLLSAVVPPDQLDAAAHSWCEHARSLPRSGVSAYKRLLAPLGPSDTWLSELEAFEALVRGQDQGQDHA
ncbi:aldehyde dehydrogenase family protein [Enhygromyxa salina]|uniref:Putative enoyl-CoA hydratase echA8 n=1 Tax=Enhygromyxa salina TaxID=215803 RepID=A0A2S9Y824_9BACT|nr:aldehyde dehydrogenase family protein [Enhygromyxa salina]PRQ01253.1 putative enoyl-CoA hydratase echA8 [Enhygromyxa salina]